MRMVGEREGRGRGGFGVARRGGGKGSEVCERYYRMERAESRSVRKGSSPME